MQAVCTALMVVKAMGDDIVELRIVMFESSENRKGNEICELNKARCL